jgi:WD40 repeat protein
MVTRTRTTQPIRLPIESTMMKSILLTFILASSMTCKGNDQARVETLVGVWRANLNADSSRIITQLRNGKLGLWDLQTGTRIPGELNDTTTVVDYALDESASLVLIQPTPGEFQIHELESGKKFSPTFKLADPSPKGVFSPDGANIWIRSTNGIVRVFESTSGKPVTEIHLPTDNQDLEFDSLPQFLQTRALVVLLDANGKLHRYNTKTWQEVMPVLSHPASDLACHLGFTVSSDGLHAATFDAPGENGPDGRLQLWDLNSSEPIGEPRIGKNGISAIFLDDSRCLIRPGRGAAKVVRMPSLKTDFEMRRHDEVEASNVRVTLGKKEKYLLSWGYDQSLFLSHLANGTHAGNTSLSCHVGSVLESDDRNHIWAVLDNSVFIGNPYHDFYVVKYSIPGLRPSATLRLQEFVHRASLSHDNKWLLILLGGTDREHIRLFDAQTLAEHPFKDDSR